MRSAVLDTRYAVEAELCSATGLSIEALRAAVRAFGLGAVQDAAFDPGSILTQAAAVSRLATCFGFQGAVRFPPPGQGPDCWFFPSDAETVGLVIIATSDLADVDRLAAPPTPAPIATPDRISGAQASIVQAFFKAQRVDAAAHRGKWLLIYTRLSGFTDRVWDLLRTRFAAEDQIAPYARAFVVDIGETQRGFEL